MAEDMIIATLKLKVKWFVQDAENMSSMHISSLTLKESILYGIGERSSISHSLVYFIAHN